MFPYRGFPEEVDKGKGLGYTVNIIMPVGATDKHYRKAFNEIVHPLMKAMKPRAVVVLLGLDTHWKDKLTDINTILNIYADLDRLVQHCRLFVCVLGFFWWLWGAFNAGLAVIGG